MMGLQVIIMVGFLTVIGAVMPDALKEVQWVEEVLDLPGVTTMMRVATKEVVVGEEAEVKIGGLRTREVVAVIG